MLESIPVIQPAEQGESSVRALPVLDDTNVAGHRSLPDGTPVLLLRFNAGSGPAVRLHFSGMRLPAGAALFLYTMRGDGNVEAVRGPYTGTGPSPVGDFWTDPLAGSEVYVEVVWGEQIPADIPFAVPELAVTEPFEALPDGPGPVSEVRTSTYRGLDLTYEVRDGVAIFEDDIILGTADDVQSAATSKSAVREAVGITGSWYRWPGGLIPYTISSNIPDQQRIHDAISHWNTMLSGVIRLVPRSSQSDYVQFKRNGTCSSVIGRNGGMQPLYVADSCSKGSIVHEIGHAVGLWHEQSRADRNSHVKILWDNMASSVFSNFTQIIDLGDDIGAYDFGSIMHYNAYAFSSNGQPTIETIPAGISIGQRTALSAGDIAAVRKMYGASTSTPTTQDPAPTPIPVTSPSTASVTVSTNPSGEMIRVDGSVYSTPRTFTWTLGSVHTVEALNESATTTERTVWTRWSDGGAQTHTVTAQSGLTSLIATYRTSYRLKTSTSGAGQVSVSPNPADDFYPAGSAVALNAQPSAGYCFLSWTGLLSGTPAQTTLTVSKPYDIRANFGAGAFSLSPSYQTISAAGGTIDISVKGSGSCTWSATPLASWLTISSGRTGAGSGVMRVSVARNTGAAARFGMITVNGGLFMLMQGGAN